MTPLITPLPSHPIITHHNQSPEISLMIEPTSSAAFHSRSLKRSGGGTMTQRERRQDHGINVLEKISKTGLRSDFS